MLIIGDKVINDYNKNFKVNRTEVIYNGESDLRFAMVQLKLKAPEVLNKYTTRFIKNDHSYLFHNAEKNEGLKMMMMATFSNKKCFKMSPLLYEFVIRQVKVNYINTSISDWHSNISTMLELRDKLDNTVYSHSDFKKEINYLSTYIMEWVETLPNIRLEHYAHRPFDIYKRYDIMNVICRGKKSIYQDISMSIDGDRHSVGEYMFKRLQYQDKIDCVLEKIQTDVFNDYTLRNHLMDPKDNVHKLMSLCKRSLMNNINSKVADTTGNKTFKTFMILNYKQIIDSIDYDFYYLFNEAIKYDILKKKK